MITLDYPKQKKNPFQLNKKCQSIIPHLFRSVYRWGSTYQIYSYRNVWVVFDGYFVHVTPASTVKGRHCGMCGNFNRNRFDEFVSKDRTFLKTAEEMMDSYKYKC